jgi:hypothetical protein
MLRFVSTTDLGAVLHFGLQRSTRNSVSLNVGFDRKCILGSQMQGMTAHRP